MTELDQGLFTFYAVLTTFVLLMNIMNKVHIIDSDTWPDWILVPFGWLFLATPAIVLGHVLHFLWR